MYCGKGNRLRFTAVISECNQSLFTGRYSWACQYGPIPLKEPSNYCLTQLDVIEFYEKFVVYSVRSPIYPYTYLPIFLSINQPTCLRFRHLPPNMNLAAMSDYKPLPSEAPVFPTRIYPINHIQSSMPLLLPGPIYLPESMGYPKEAYGSTAQAL